MQSSTVLLKLAGPLFYYLGFAVSSVIKVSQFQVLVFYVLVYLTSVFFCKTQPYLLLRTPLKSLSHSSRNVLCRADQVVLADPTIKIDALLILNEVELGVPLANSSFEQPGNKVAYHTTISRQVSLSPLLPFNHTNASCLPLLWTETSQSLNSKNDVYN